MTVDLAQLLRVRLLVARHGEMDRARWWNSRGMLGNVGEKAISRGFPRTHHFAQARVVFAIAAERCREVFNPPSSATLWSLPAEIEDHFDSEWSRWIERAAEWAPYFERLAALRSEDLLADAGELGLADEKLIAEARQLRRSAKNRAVPIPAPDALDTRTITLLGLGFFRGEPGSPAIPFMKMGA